MNVGGIMFDLSDQQGGFEAPPDGLDQKTCPRCGSETVASFGLMGGGYGPYVICTSSVTVSRRAAGTTSGSRTTARTNRMSTSPQDVAE